MVDPARFDIEVGRGIARKDAEKQLWLVEGYQLQNMLYWSDTLGQSLPKEIRDRFANFVYAGEATSPFETGGQNEIIDDEA